ncbi:MAG: thioesterase family protein [Pyrinomonadaceae bacterium]
MNQWHETEIRVRYAETDQMGVVYHANYLIWFEIGRSEICRSRGFSYRDMEQDHNRLLVVAECCCRYKSPAFYEDLITVRTNVEEVRSRSIRFIYEIYRASDNILLADGETLHLITDENKRVRSLPDIYRQKLIAEIAAADDENFSADQAPS